MKRIPGWVDKLKETDFERLLNNDKILDDVPFFTDEKIKKMIYDKSNYKTEKINILNFIIGKPFLRYSLSFVLILVLIVSAFLLVPGIYNRYIENKNMMICKVLNVNGNIGYIKKNKNFELLKNDNLKEGTILYTNDNSEVELLIEDKSFISLNENTKLKIEKIRDNNQFREQKYKLFNGEITLKPAKIKDNSTFEIITEYFIIGAKGTIFKVGIDKKKNYKISVDEGEVYVKLNKTEKIINALNKLPTDISSEIDEIYEEEIIINENHTVGLTYDKINEMNKNILKIVNEINTYTKDDKLKKKKIKINLIINNYIIIKSTENELNEENTNNSNFEEEDKINYSLKKINKINNNKLEERNTAITSDGNNIFIVSKKNKKIFCINSANGKLKWAFKSASGNLTSPVAVYKNKIIIAEPNLITILNNNGKIIGKHEISKGPNYWGYPLVIKNNLYIPGQEKVYTYDGSSINTLDSIPVSLGQIYISKQNEKLICNFSLEKKIYIYDTVNNKIIFAFDKIKNRSFNTPLAYLNNVYTADNDGYIYKIDYTSETKFKELYVKTGVISNIVYLKNKIYFVANDGFLYSVNANKFNKYNKISRFENNNDIDKYLNKKIIVYKNRIIYCSDFGNLICYDPVKNITDEIAVNKDSKNPLICNPVEIKSSLYFVDIMSNIYKFDLFD